MDTIPAIGLFLAGMIVGGVLNVIICEILDERTLRKLRK